MADNPQVQAPEMRSSAVIAERHRNPAEQMPTAPAANYVFAGICAILATLVFIGILAVLWLDWSALKMA